MQRKVMVEAIETTYYRVFDCNGLKEETPSEARAISLKKMWSKQFPENNPHRVVKVVNVDGVSSMDYIALDID